MLLALILGGGFLVVMLAAWRYDRRRGGTRVTERDADAEVRLADSAFQGNGNRVSRH